MNNLNQAFLATTYVHPDKVVDVFKTNVHAEGQAQLIILELKKIWPAARVNFDLDDCDKILRIESPADPVDAQQVVRVVMAAGYLAEVLL